MRKYTKADLERIVVRQFENLNALSIQADLLKKENEALEEIVEKLRDELKGKTGVKAYCAAGRKRK